MVKAIYTCDGCGRTKGDTNHWYGVEEMGSRSTLHPTLRIVSFDDSGRDMEHICSDDCLTKRLAQFSDTLRVSHKQMDDSSESEAEAKAGIGG